MPDTGGASVPPARRVWADRPTGRASEEEFEDWLREATERADPFMAWLGILFALLVGFQLAVDVRPPVDVALDVAGWTIWAVFVVEFTAKLWLAPARLRFVREHWLQLTFLVLPTLRFLSFLRLVRLGRALPATRIVSSSFRSVGTAKTLLRSRLGYLAALSVVAIVAVAELAYLFERDAAPDTFDSFGEALFWSASAVIGMQADPVPVSWGARAAMLLAFLCGLVIIASLAGSLGTFLVESRRERADAE